MLNDVTKLRRATARAIQHQPGLAALRRTMMVMLPVWLVYFFAIKLFVKNLNAITVPVVDMPLGTYLVILGAFAVFAAVWSTCSLARSAHGRRRWRIAPAASRPRPHRRRPPRNCSTTSRRCGRARCSAT